MGYEVGPDLSDMSHRSVEDLAYNILDPNMPINPSYIAYEAETLDGELITGIPSAQSSSVTLLMAQGVQRSCCYNSQSLIGNFSHAGGVRGAAQCSGAQKSHCLPSNTTHPSPSLCLRRGQPIAWQVQQSRGKKPATSVTVVKDARSESRIHT